MTQRICDERHASENRSAAMTGMTAMTTRERQSATRGEGRSRAGTYRVIDTPHKHAEQRLVRAEQLNLLVLHPEVLLLQLAEPAGHLRHARHACRLRHRHPALDLDVAVRARLPKRGGGGWISSRALLTLVLDAPLGPPSSISKDGEGWDDT